MYNVLFNFEFEEFLGISSITLYTYAFLIVLGTVVASIYTKKQSKKQLQIELKNPFFYFIFFIGFFGGKLFLFFEKPIYFFQNPDAFISHLFSGGFVFYGSFICIILGLLWYFKKYQMPLLPMLDILAITTTIVHSFGRLGCFAAGCCYGVETNSVFGLVFPKTFGVKVHPTQLYEVFLLIIIMCILFGIKSHKKFSGQVFLTYLILYAFGRGILEFFRGDERGFVIENIVSHSQGIAIILIVFSTYIYHKLNLKSITTQTL